MEEPPGDLPAGGPAVGDRRLMEAKVAAVLNQEERPNKRSRCTTERLLAVVDDHGASDAINVFDGMGRCVTRIELTLLEDTRLNTNYQMRGVRKHMDLVESLFNAGLQEQNTGIRSERILEYLHQSLLALRWAGIDLQVEGRFAQRVDAHFASVTAAIADVFPEEGFAELVLSFAGAMVDKRQQ